MPLFTDLAVESLRELSPHKPLPDGIEFSEDKNALLPWERVRVKSDEGADFLQKEKGEYLTVLTGALWLDEREKFREKLFFFRDLLLPFFSGAKGAPVLVAGLGNRGVTCDAIGPGAVKNLIVTRHIKAASPFLFENLGLSEVCALTPGVLGQTGIESGDVVASVAKAVRPGLVVVIDALAARDLQRLVKTVQISDTGLSPGAGVGNRRPEISERTLGVKVVSIGVPTVVDAATMARDLLRRFGEKGAAEKAGAAFEGEMNFFVTPKETDEVIRSMGAFLGYALNLALNENLSFEDMVSLAG